MSTLTFDIVHEDIWPLEITYINSKLRVFVSHMKNSTSKHETTPSSSKKQFGPHKIITSDMLL